jgi:hypothetical protein
MEDITIIHFILRKYKCLLMEENMCVQHIKGDYIIPYLKCFSSENLHHYI